jgi:hypothetical protein
MKRSRKILFMCDKNENEHETVKKKNEHIRARKLKQCANRVIKHFVCRECYNVSHKFNKLS